MLPARALDPAPAAVPVPAPDLAAAYTVWLAATGRGNKAYALGARSFLARWPDPQGWAAEPLAVRLAARSHTRPLLNFLMLHGHLRPGYDYLLERKLSALGCQPARSGPTSTASSPRPPSSATPSGPALAWPPRSRPGC